MFLRCITMVMANVPPMLRHRACEAPPGVKRTALGMLCKGREQSTAFTHAEARQTATEGPLRWPRGLGFPHTAESGISTGPVDVGEFLAYFVSVAGLR